MRYVYEMLMPKTKVLIFVFALFSAFHSSISVAANILIIDSYHQEYLWSMRYRDALFDELGNDNSIRVEYLDTKRVPEWKYLINAERVWNEYLKQKPDVVIIGDDNGINLLAKRIAKNGTAVVYLGMNNSPRNNGIYGMDNVTGVLERPLFKRNIVEMKNLLPNVRRVLVLFDTSDVAHVCLEDGFGGIGVLTYNGMQIDIRLIGNYETWQKVVLNAKKDRYDMLFVGLYQTIFDAEGQYVDPQTILNWVGENSNIPAFGLWDFSIGKNQAVGGLVLTAREQGLEAAKLVKKILAGARAESLPVVMATRGEYLFSKSGLKRWHITLPADMAKKAKLME